MPTHQPESTAVDRHIASCALDRSARAEQQARYRCLAGAVSQVDRNAQTLVVQFDERLDRALLERTLAIERRCCPFFAFRFDDHRRRLTVGVRDADQAPALDVIAAAFTPTSG